MHGMCSQRNVQITAKQTTPAIRPPHERITNDDREATALLLRSAFSDGILHVEEFDERLAGVYRASTVGDLEPLTGDLPSDWLRKLEAKRKAERRAALHARFWRAEFRSYLGVMALLVMIWLLTSGVGEHPWPIWPAMGWGIPLFLSRPRGALGSAIRRWTLAGAR
jgi:Domain of unknown function (DUF1707)/2TM domain